MTLKRILFAMRSVFRKGRFERDMADEMAYHIEMETRQGVERGLSEAAARKAAIRQFGGEHYAKEACRDAWASQWIVDWLRDLEYGLRVARKNWIVTLSSILCLGLCIGASSALASALYELVYRPLPYVEADRLVEVYSTFSKEGLAKTETSFPVLDDLKSEADRFESATMVQKKWGTLESGDVARRSVVVTVTPGFFETLGVPLLVGNTSDVEGDRVDSNVAVLSYSEWKGASGLSDGSYRETMRVDGQSYRVVGVAPKSIERILPQTALFVFREAPVASESPWESRTERDGRIFARLSDGLSLANAQSILSSVNARALADAGEEMRLQGERTGFDIRVDLLAETNGAWLKERLQLLNAQVGGFSLISVTGILGLLLARTNSRIRDFATRQALGASWMAIFRQLLAEMMCVSLGAWFISVLVARAGVAFMVGNSENLFGEGFAVGFGVVGAAFGLAVSLGFGFSVALILTRRAVSAGHGRLFSTERSGGLDRGTLRTLASLSSAQIAMTVVLLVCAGLIARSYFNVASQDYGFVSEGVVTSRVLFSEQEFPEQEDLDAARNRLLEALESEISLREPSLSQGVPTFGYPERPVFVLGSDSESQDRRLAYTSHVSGAYFETLGIGLSSGRFFEPQDEVGWREPLVVDQRFVDRYLPEGNPIGRSVAVGNSPANQGAWPVIVGVVETARYASLDDRNELPMVYRPLRGAYGARELSVMTRATGSEVSALQAISRAIDKVDSRLVIYRSGRLDTFIDQALGVRKSLFSLSGGLAGICVLITSIGTGGMIAYGVSARLREFGIRKALGGTRSQLLIHLIVSNCSPTFVGVVLGTAVAGYAATFLAPSLFGVGPFDARTYVEAVLAVIAPSLLAMGIASWSATGVEPSVALRE